MVDPYLSLKAQTQTEFRAITRKEAIITQMTIRTIVGKYDGLSVFERVAAFQASPGKITIADMTATAKIS